MYTRTEENIQFIDHLYETKQQNIYMCYILHYSSDKKLTMNIHGQ